MAKIPRASQTQVASATPQPWSSGGGYTAVGAANQQLGSSIASAGKAIAGAFGEAAAADEEHQMFQAKLALTDFQAQQQSQQMEYDASITGDGSGHVENRVASYDQSYQSDLRDKFANAPEKVRQFIELNGARIRGNVQNSSTATAVKQRGNYYVESTNSVLQTQILPQITSDPKSLDMAIQASEGVINAIPDKSIASSVKAKAAKMIYEHWRSQAGEGAEETAKGFIGSRTTGSEDRTGSFATGQFDGVKGKGGTQSGTSQRPSTVSILAEPPSHAERKAIFSKGGVVVNLDTNSTDTPGQTTPMVVIPDNATPEQRQAAEAYASKIADLYKQQFGSSKAPRVVTRSQNGRGRPATIHTEPYAVTDAQAVKFFSSPEGARAHAAILRDTFGKVPGAQFSIPHMPSKGDHGAEANGVNEVKLAKMVLDQLAGAPVDQRVADASGQTVPMQPATIRDYIANQMVEDLPAIQRASQAAAAANLKAHYQQIENEALHDLQRAPDEVLSERLSQYYPQDINDPEYTQKMDIYQKLAKEVGVQRTLRATAPARSVESFPEVVAAREALKPGDPETHIALAETLDRAQQSIGIVDTQVVPPDLAQKYLMSVSMAHPQEIPAKMEALASQLSKMYGHYADKAFMDVIRSGSKDTQLVNLAWPLLQRIRSGLPAKPFELEAIARAADSASITQMLSTDPTFTTMGMNAAVQPFSIRAPEVRHIEMFTKAIEAGDPDAAKQFDEAFGPGSAAFVANGGKLPEPDANAEWPKGQGMLEPEEFKDGSFAPEPDDLGSPDDLPPDPAASAEPQDRFERLNQNTQQILEMLNELVGITPAEGAETPPNDVTHPTQQPGAPSAVDSAGPPMGDGPMPNSYQMDKDGLEYDTGPSQFRQRDEPVVPKGKSHELAQETGSEEDKMKMLDGIFGGSDWQNMDAKKLVDELHNRGLVSDGEYDNLDPVEILNELFKRGGKPASEQNIPTSGLQGSDRLAGGAGDDVVGDVSKSLYGKAGVVDEVSGKTVLDGGVGSWTKLPQRDDFDTKAAMAAVAAASEAAQTPYDASMEDMLKAAAKSDFGYTDEGIDTIREMAKTLGVDPKKIWPKYDGQPDETTGASRFWRKPKSPDSEIPMSGLQGKDKMIGQSGSDAVSRFNDPSDIEFAINEGKVDPSERDALMKKHFPEFYAKEQEEKKRKGKKRGN